MGCCQSLRPCRQVFVFPLESEAGPTASWFSFYGRIQVHSVSCYSRNRSGFDPKAVYMEYITDKVARTQLLLTESNVYWTVHHCNSWRMKDQLDVTCYFISFHLLRAQHVSDINISIFRSLRLCWWITTSVVLFSVRCVLELLVRLVLSGVRFAGWSLVFGGVRFAGFSLQNEHHQIPAATKTPTRNELRTRRPMW